MAPGGSRLGTEMEKLAALAYSAVAVVLCATPLVVSGCRGCGEARQSVIGAAQPGRLTPAVVAVTPVEPPSTPDAACAVVGAPSVDEGVVPLEVHFTAEGMCTAAQGTFTWDFGDGSAPGAEQNPVHVYQQPGSYTARVTLTDREHGVEDSDESPIEVTAR